MNCERRDKICEILEKQNTVKNSYLMKRFGISIETVRRDLAYLEQKGVLKRVYGGAVKKQFINSEPEYKNRETLNHGDKYAIALEASKFIDEKDTVFFDQGTTILSLAKLIDSNKKITAFTNSLRTAIALSEKGFDVIIPGGKVRNEELSVSGSIAEKNMAEFNIDKAIIGVAGITADGISDFNSDEALARRQVIKNADRVIVLADYSKFAVRAMCNVCPLSDIDIIITDKKAPSDMIKDFEKRGIRVIVAKNNI